MAKPIQTVIYKPIILKHFETWNFANARKERDDFILQLVKDGYEILRKGCINYKSMPGHKCFWVEAGKISEIINS